MKTNQLLGTVLVLQGLVLIGQWTGGNYLNSAQAQASDPAGRQIQMIDELKTLNGKMDQVIDLLKGGDLQVKVSKPDDSKESGHGK